MKKLIAFTVMILCLTLAAGFNGIAGADNKKDQGEEMINMSHKVEKTKEAAMEEGKEIVDEAEMHKEDVEMKKHEMADETVKKMDEHSK